MVTICASCRPAHKDTSAVPGGRFIQSRILDCSSAMQHRFVRRRRQSIARTPSNRNALYNPARLHAGKEQRECARRGGRPYIETEERPWQSQLTKNWKQNSQKWKNREAATV